MGPLGLGMIGGFASSRVNNTAVSVMETAVFCADDFVAKLCFFNYAVGVMR